MCDCALRRADDQQVQPVPRIPEEGELTDAETSGRNFDEHLKDVDGDKSGPVQ